MKPKSFTKLREDLHVPAIGQTYSRDLMPQIKDPQAFIEHLRNNNVHVSREKIDPGILKSTQLDFDINKIHSLLGSDENPPIITSKDNHVLDGHHRWLANHYAGKMCDCYKTDLPILELMRMAKEHINQDTLNEGIDHNDLQPHMDKFVKFVSRKLKLKKTPPIHFVGEFNATSFGGYNPHEEVIHLHTKNRHPMDIFRTLAHELVHHQQKEHGRIEHVQKDGKTGSPIEDEANYMAGRLMRQWGKKNPKMFGMEALNEACWKGYHQPKKQKLKPKEGAPGRFVPNCVPNKNAKTKVEETVKITEVDSKFSRFLESTPSDREWGKESLTRIFKEATPGQSFGCKEDQQNEENCTCSQAQKGKSPVVPDDIQGGSRFPTSPLFEKKKFVRKKVLDEDGVLDTASGAVGLPQSDSIGAEFGVAKSPGLIGGLVGVSSPVAGMGPAGSLYPFGTYGISEEKTGKSLSKLKENWESIADRESTPIGKSHVEVKEESPAWQRKEGKNPEGGLNKKGVASYRREHPGSKLQTAVTTKPSKLNPDSKAAKRRKSFCARMSGMPGPMKDEKGRPTRKALSLRKWNCE